MHTHPPQAHKPDHPGRDERGGPVIIHGLDSRSQAPQVLARAYGLRYTHRNWHVEDGALAADELVTTTLCRKSVAAHCDYVGIPNALVLGAEEATLLQQRVLAAEAAQQQRQLLEQCSAADKRLGGTASEAEPGAIVQTPVPTHDPGRDTDWQPLEWPRVALVMACVVIAALLLAAVVIAVLYPPAGALAGGV